MSNTNNNLQTQTSSALHNDMVSSCSISKVQEKIQLSKEGCMKSLKALQSHFTFLTDTLKDFGGVLIFKRTLSQDMNLLEKHLTKEIIYNSSSTRDSTIVKLKEVAADTRRSENSILETALNKSVKDCNLDSETKDVHAIKYKMSKAKERS
ncbi:hypothetical protein Tco_1089543 [Tanacetum coccineum]